MSSRATVERPARVLCRQLRRIISVFCCCDAAKALRLRISARLTVAQKRTAARRPLFPEEIVMKSFSCQCPRAILNVNSSISPRVKPMSSSS